MAELKLTALQQRFLLAIIEGKPPAEAFKAARAPVAAAKNLPDIKHSTATGEGNKLLKHPALAAALARARATLQERTLLRVEDFVEQLMEAREVALACEPPQASAAVAASMGAAKLLGLVVDRSQVDVVHHKPSLLPTKQLELSEDEWKRQFVTGHNDR